MPGEYRFGEYVLDVGRRIVHDREGNLHLGERAFGVLIVLVERAGQVVAKQDLMDAVWRDVVVTEDSLARAISDLRSALEDDASRPRYIRTVHRRGYVFVAPVIPVEESETVVRADDRPRWRGVRFLGWRVGLVVLAALMAVLLGRQRVERIDDGADVPLPDVTEWRLRALGPLPFTARAIKPAFAKTSDLLAVVAPDAETGIHTLFLLRPDGGEPLQLTHDIEVRGPSPEFTADDSHIFFTTYHGDPELGMVPEVWRVPVPAGEPSLLLENASAASSSPDGRHLVYAAVDADGTSIRVRHEDGTELEIAARGFWPRWSPDGRWIAYTTSDPEGGDGTIHVVRPDGSGERQLTTIAAQVYGLSWTPDGARVLFSSQEGGPTTLWSIDVESGERLSVTRGPGDCTCPTMAPDGRRLVFDFSYRRWFLYLLSEPGEPPRRILVEAGIRDAALSPEGSRIAVAGGAEAQSPVLSVLDLRTGKRRTVSGMAASAVGWTSDGEELLAAAPAPDGQSEWIWRLALAGGLPEPILKGDERWSAPSASPDGSRVAAVRRTRTGSELVVHHPGTGVTRALAEEVAIATPRWSPDGRFLAWSGPRRPDFLGSGGVWVCPIEGGSPRQLSVDGAWPVWERDSAHLLFFRFLENEGIWRVPLSGGLPRRVQRLEGVMEGLHPEGLDNARSGVPLLLRLEQTTAQIYLLEPPTD